MEGSMCYDRDVHSLKATELTLGLPGNNERTTTTTPRGTKRALEEVDSRSENKSIEHHEEEVELPKAKAQVVGWPPVRSYRKNGFQARKTETTEAATGMFVKVSMDGAPYLRKIDLKVYKGYKELREALESMFKCFSLGNKDDSTLEIFNTESEYAVTYEDKDGDWMLVGDVPWGMFVSSCKRLRIMRGSEARGSN